MLNPQMTIDQLPDKDLAVFGWNTYEALDTHRRQAQLCEQNVLAIRQEFERRNQAKLEAQGRQEAEKRTERELLLEELMAKLDKRGSLPPAANGTPPASESKAE